MRNNDKVCVYVSVVRACVCVLACVCVCACVRACVRVSEKAQLCKPQLNNLSSVTYFPIFKVTFITIIFHHEFRPEWPVSVSAVISSSSLLSGRPGRRLPFG
jgi:hypothetical protein